MNSNDVLAAFESALSGIIANSSELTAGRLRELIEQLRSLPSFAAISDSDAEFIARSLEARMGITMTIGPIVVTQAYEPWLAGRRSAITPFYWARYQKMLLLDKKFSRNVVTTIGDETDRALGWLEDPNKPGEWDRRGMVVGHVQSGKTANYLGLMCKAADAGYRVIVVIAGVHNNLRNQTQERVDEGFVGFDSNRRFKTQADTVVGVGRYDRTRRPVTFTNARRDFSKEMASAVGMSLESLTEPVVFVIKKNSATLTNLIEWFKEQRARNAQNNIDHPMLLIDDEADNASINVKYSKEEVSRINGLIRELLGLFARKCYVAYTATPFANIFIDPVTDHEMFGEDLFPRDFISSLDAPTNYFGPAEVFVEPNDGPLRHITDNESCLPVRHKIDARIAELPQSLLLAVRTFILARAIRTARGHTAFHCTMLVNASRFVAVQRQLRLAIQGYLEEMAASVRVSGALPELTAMRDPHVAALHAAWLSEYSSTGPSWSDVSGHLLDAIGSVVVVEVNNKSKGALDYAANEKHGLTVVAVGGFSLSRGLTLEGLVVSYFLRNSMMYDTLMQMGRWFGYRPGYQDLCRVWMTKDAAGWYEHIAESIEGLRDELRQMESASATPLDFGLKVRGHPDSLIVTARNKMGSGKSVVVEIGLGNSFVETTVLRNQDNVLEKHRSEAKKLIGEITVLAGGGSVQLTRAGGGHLFCDVPAQYVIDYLHQFDNHPASMLSDIVPITKYIEARVATSLGTWDVLLAGTSEADATRLRWGMAGVEVACQRRTAGIRSDRNAVYVGNKGRVASRGVERTGLDADVVRNLEHDFEASNPGKRNVIGKLNYPDRIYRIVERKPLLIMHPLEIVREGGEALGGEPIIAWSISFPRPARAEETVSYVVNTTWLREYYGDDTGDDDLEDDDD